MLNFPGHLEHNENTSLCEITSINKSIFSDATGENIQWSVIKRADFITLNSISFMSIWTLSYPSFILVIEINVL